MRKKVIIFYIQPASGHFIAAKSINNAFKLNHPDIEIYMLDFMNYINPLIANLLLKTYSNVIKRSPETWDFLYDNPNVLKKTQKLRNLIIRLNLTRLKKILNEINPEAIICTQAIPCSALAFYKQKQNANFKIISAVTDFTTHSYWVYDEVDHYMVPSEREKWRLLSKGVSSKKIHVTGIPIDPKYKEKKDIKILKEKYDLDPNKITVLIMGGSQGLGKIKTIVNQVCKIEIDFQLLILAGTNKSLLKKMTDKKNIGKNNKNIKVFSHIDYVDELMEISDILITKPGGLTTSEALAKELPMILTNPIPGQEKQNSEYLVGEKVALTANNIEELIKTISELLQNPEALRELSFQTQRLKKPDSAERIAELLCLNF